MSVLHIKNIRRRGAGFLLCLALLLTVMTPMTAAAETGDAVVTLSGGMLNVRSAPGGEILTTLGNGTAVRVTGSQTDSGCTVWYAVALGDKTGYVSSAYVAMSPTDSDTSVNRTGRTAESGAELHSCCDSSFGKILSLNANAGLTVIAQRTVGETPWYYVRTASSRCGWILASDVTIPQEDEVPAERDAYYTYLASLGFPESYHTLLWQLHQQYPQWTFTPFLTGVDWNEAVNAETELGRSLVQSSAPSSWKSTQDGAYNWLTSTWIELDSGGWVAASRDIVAYYMDPRNLLNSESVFQFLYQGFDAAAQTKEMLTAMVQGTFLADTERDTAPETEGLQTYADALWDGGSTHGVNPCVLAAMMLQEMGTAGASQSISGTNSRFPGVYNAFNIGAYKTEQFSAVERGLWYASGGSGGVGTSNSRPWTSLYKAICGGAQFYGENYVAAGQTTLYLKRFNVQGERMYRNQYMTNVSGANSEGLFLAEAYSEAMRGSALSFSIPVYNNMPAATCMPGGDGSPNAALASLTVDTGVLSPEFQRDITEYTLIVPHEVTSLSVEGTPLSAGAAVTGSGTTALQVGCNTLPVTVTAENGTTRTYTISVWRQESTETPAPESTETPAPAAPEPTSEPSPEPTDGELLTVSILPGDLNGDGTVQINDLILLRNYLLGNKALEGTALTAADTNGDGVVQINDLIRLRNHLLGTAPLF